MTQNVASTMQQKKRPKLQLKQLGDCKPSEELFHPISCGEFSDLFAHVPVDGELKQGLIAGSTVLFTAEPGFGKTTLMAMVLDAVAGSTWSFDGSIVEPVLVSCEMSAEELWLMLSPERLGKTVDFSIWDGQLDEFSGQHIKPSVADVISLIESGDHRVVVVDSLQGMRYNPTFKVGDMAPQFAAGVIEKIIAAASKAKVAVIIIGHVTKDGKYAGKTSVKHDVAQHLHGEVKRRPRGRFLVCEKNRFGPAGPDTERRVVITSLGLKMEPVDQDVPSEEDE